jgi:hypothetical protein
MRHLSSMGFAAGLVLAQLLAPRPTFGQTAGEAGRSGDKAAAQMLFEEGRTLMDAKHYEKACPKLAESQRLDPAFGTLLNLGRCYEFMGKTASAWINYLEAVATAKKQGRADRDGMALKLADALRPQISKITIMVPNQVPGLEILRGGAVVREAQWGSAVPVDPGEYTLEAKAPGWKPWSKKVTVRPKADMVEVTVPALARDEKSDSSGKNEGAEGDGTVPTALGWTAIGLGLVGGAVGVVLRLAALSKDAASDDYCNPNNDAQCLQAGVDLRAEAQQLQLGSLIGWIGGGAFLVTGIVLVLAAPSGPDTEEATGKETDTAASRIQWSAAVGPDGGRLLVRMRW